LLRAGFFHPNAINYYIFARFGAVVASTLITYVAIETLLPHASRIITFLLMAIMISIAILGPDAYSASTADLAIRISGFA
jgi:tight adherence protein C